MKPPLLLTTILSLVSWGLTLFIIIYVPPTRWLAILSLLTTSFFALSSLTTLILYGLLCFSSDKFTNRHQIFNESLRQGTLISSVIVIAATLKVIQAASWLHLTLLILIAAGIEYYFRRYL